MHCCETYDRREGDSPDRPPSMPRAFKLVRLSALVFWTSSVFACSILNDLGGFADGKSDLTTDGAPDDGRHDDVTVVDASDAADEDAISSLADVDAASLTGCNAPGLVAEWKFDEGTGSVASDCTGHGYDATLMGGAAWAAGANSGAAIDFPAGGTAYAEVLAAGGLRFAGPITLVARVLLRTFSSKGRIAASSLYPNDLGLDLTVESTNGMGKTNYFSIIFAHTQSDGGIAQTYTSTDSLPASTWTNVAAVYDGTNIRIYKNGVLGEEHVAPPDSVRRVGSQPFYLGRRTDCCFMDGAIDDLRIYNRAVAVDEIALLNAAL